MEEVKHTMLPFLLLFGDVRNVVRKLVFVMKSEYMLHLPEECSRYGGFVGKDNAFSSDILVCLDK